MVGSILGKHFCISTWGNLVERLPAQRQLSKVNRNVLWAVEDLIVRLPFYETDKSRRF